MKTKLNASLLLFLLLQVYSCTKSDDSGEIKREERAAEIYVPEGSRAPKDLSFVNLGGFKSFVVSDDSKQAPRLALSTESMCKKIEGCMDDTCSTTKGLKFLEKDQLSDDTTTAEKTEQTKQTKQTKNNFCITHWERAKDSKPGSMKYLMRTLEDQVFLIDASMSSDAIPEEAGPLSNHSHALQECPQVCIKKNINWTGHWWTTKPGKMSVCLCQTAAKEAIKNIYPLNQYNDDGSDKLKLRLLQEANQQSGMKTNNFVEAGDSLYLFVDGLDDFRTTNQVNPHPDLISRVILKLTINKESLQMDQVAKDVENWVAHSSGEIIYKQYSQNSGAETKWLKKDNQNKDIILDIDNRLSIISPSSLKDETQKTFLIAEESTRINGLGEQKIAYLKKQEGNFKGVKGYEININLSTFDEITTKNEEHYKIIAKDSILNNSKGESFTFFKEEKEGSTTQLFSTCKKNNCSGNVDYLVADRAWLSNTPFPIQNSHRAKRAKVKDAFEDSKAIFYHKKEYKKEASSSDYYKYKSYIFTLPASYNKDDILAENTEGSVTYYTYKTCNYQSDEYTESFFFKSGTTTKQMMKIMEKKFKTHLCKTDFSDKVSLNPSDLNELVIERVKQEDGTKRFSGEFDLYYNSDIFSEATIKYTNHSYETGFRSYFDHYDNHNQSVMINSHSTFFYLSIKEDSSGETINNKALINYIDEKNEKIASLPFGKYISIDNMNTNVKIFSLSGFKNDIFILAPKAAIPFNDLDPQSTNTNKKTTAILYQVPINDIKEGKEIFESKEDLNEYKVWENNLYTDLEITPFLDHFIFDVRTRQGNLPKKLKINIKDKKEEELQDKSGSLGASWTIQPL
jgi:hypothetical protein